MKIGGLQKVSLIDFPGHIAAVVFTQGCPWRCPYCHNPSLVLPERFGECISEEVIWNHLHSHKIKLDGVVISGGEPTLHPDLTEFIKKIRSGGFAVKLDTNGTFPDRLQKLLKEKLVDYVAMDLKASWENYQKITGTAVEVEKIKESMRLIRESGAAYEWRTTVHPQLPIDVLQISSHIKRGERYYLQEFRASDDILDPNLRKQVDPLLKGELLSLLSERGILAAWR